MNKAFECHVVFKPEDKETVSVFANTYNFSVSYLVGDEDLGDEKMMYCTIRENEFDTIKTRMDMFLNAIQYSNAKPLRAKIEATLYDKRF